MGQDAVGASRGVHARAGAATRAVHKAWLRGERAVRVGDAIETGTVFMNRADYLDPGLCWTGCKNTGKGGGLSVIGYHDLTRPKSYHLKKVTK